MLRILFVIDTFISRMFAFWVRLRDRLYWKFTSSKKRRDVTVQNYNSVRDYLPGGVYFEKGLFDWEEKVISKYFPSQGNILVGGCGGGRELVQLDQKGYSVFGFDPSEHFIETFRQKYNQNRYVNVAVGSYEDLIEDKLASTLHPRKFDGVILGWSSFSHMTSSDERLHLLKTLKKISPEGPVLVSFYVSDPPRNSYWPQVGFIHQFSSKELQDLAQQSGYQILELETSVYPQPYAVLSPK